MVKKGKYKLLSYFIEDHLIFYKSINKAQNFIAFSIFEVNDFYPAFSILLDYLKKKFLNYFSIQLDYYEKSRILFILSFQDKNKNSIVKIFHLLHQKLYELISDINFLERNKLNHDFFDIIVQELNPDMEISKTKDSLLLLNDKIPTILQIYTIDLNLMQKEDFFINNFLRLLNDYNRKGNLVFNICYDANENLVLSSFLVEPRKIESEIINFEKEINSFYGYPLIIKRELEIKHIWNLIWRIGPFNSSVSLENVPNLFSSKEETRFKDLTHLNSSFEEILLANLIKFKRINPNLLFINPKSLFFTFDTINFELILKILKKYIKKYIIYILVLNKKDYEDLFKIEKIRLLDNIKIMNSTDFFNFDFNSLKKV